MERVGYFVVGNGSLGEYLFDKEKTGISSDRHVYSPHYIEYEEDTQYWENRGYKIIPAYVINEDYDDYKVYVPEENNEI